MRLLATLFLTLVYLADTGDMSAWNVWLGFGLSAFISLAVIPSTSLAVRNLLPALLALAQLFGEMLVETLRAGITLALGVFRPHLGLQPHVVRVPLPLGTSPGARAILIHTLTLTPGELGLESEPDELILHTLQIPDVEGLRKTVQHRIDLWSRVESLWRRS
jgi:multisubunit Na+/H+ antiporter MnhE subunit